MAGTPDPTFISSLDGVVGDATQLLQDARFVADLPIGPGGALKTVQLTMAQVVSYVAAQLGSTGSGSPTAPAAPENLTATANGSSANLTWDRVDEADRYRLFRARVSSGSVGAYTAVLTTTDNTETAFTDTPSSAGQYAYRIASVSASGTVSAYSSPVTVTVGGGSGGGGGGDFASADFDSTDFATAT